MAEINRAIEYTGPQKALIESKLRDVTFTYTNWGEEDISALRKAIRDFYKMEQKAICSYCRNPVSLSSVLNCHVEHIAPKSRYRNFIFEPKNLCVICADCNEIKREQETLHEEPDTVKNGAHRKEYPRSSDAFKIFQPHFDNYDDHIVIFGGQYYVDKSVKGSHTILYCKLNRRLHKFGWSAEYTDDITISALMNKWSNETDSVKRYQILNELHKLLAIAS